jgi:hypothetical protein
MQGEGDEIMKEVGISVLRMFSLSNWLLRNNLKEIKGKLWSYREKNIFQAEEMMSTKRVGYQVFGGFENHQGIYSDCSCETAFYDLYVFYNIMLYK